MRLCHLIDLPVLEFKSSTVGTLQYYSNLKCSFVQYDL